MAGWTLIALVALAALLALGWQFARASNAVGLLDWGDRMIGGTAGARLASEGAAYGADPAQRLDVMVPDGPAQAPRPVVVFIHGGGWNAGTPADYRFVGRTFARTGRVVVLAGYRLVPEGRYPAMLEDGAAALAWVHANIAQHGGDPERIVVIGHSAGAYNAVTLTLERQWLGRQGLPGDLIKGVVGLSGPYDFYPFTTDSSRAAFGHVDEPEQTQPVTHARGDAPPILLLTGDADTTVKPRNSLALAKALTAAGQPTEPVILAGVDHAGTAMKLAAPFSRDSRVLDPVMRFLDRHVPVSAPVQAAAR